MSETKARNKEDICHDTPRTDIWPNHTAVVLQVTSLCTIMQWWVGVAHGFPWFLGRLCYSVPKTISASSTHDTISVTDQIPLTVWDFSQLYLQVAFIRLCSKHIVYTNLFSPRNNPRPRYCHSCFYK